MSTKLCPEPAITVHVFHKTVINPLAKGSYPKIGYLTSEKTTQVPTGEKRNSLVISHKANMPSETLR